MLPNLQLTSTSRSLNRIFVPFVASTNSYAIFRLLKQPSRKMSKPVVTSVGVVFGTKVPFSFSGDGFIFIIAFSVL